MELCTCMHCMRLPLHIKVDIYILLENKVVFFDLKIAFTNNISKVHVVDNVATQATRATLVEAMTMQSIA